MSYIDRALEFLAAQTTWAYGPRSSPAAEPTAYAALALAAYHHGDAARRAQRWLVECQSPDGQIRARHDMHSPGWPTPLAILAWTATSDSVASKENEEFVQPTQRAIAWLLSISGVTDKQPDNTGHDATIAGWPWVAGTHSWIEPTALALLALRAAGQGSSSRAIDARRLLLDRLLPDGGCNYGNTIVLGQALLPHVEPTGLVLLALAGEKDSDRRIPRSLDYLESAIGAATTSASLAYALLGLAGHGRALDKSEAWLAAAVVRSLRRQASGELALLCLAALGANCPLILPESRRAAAG